MFSAINLLQLNHHDHLNHELLFDTGKFFYDHFYCDISIDEK